MKIDDLPTYTYQCTKAKYEGFEAKCLEIPDLSAYGDTPDEAIREIQEAVAGWLEVLEDEHLPFPEPINTWQTYSPQEATDMWETDQQPSFPTLGGAISILPAA